MAFPKRLSRQEASRYLHEMHGIRRAPGTLAKLAVIGGGPSFQKDGRQPLYTTEELDRWATERLGKMVGSTSEADARTLPSPPLGEGEGQDEPKLGSQEASSVVERPPFDKRTP